MYKIYSLDCQTRELRSTQNASAAIGNTHQAAIMVNSVQPVLGVLMAKQGGCTFYPGAALSSYELNGEPKQGSAQIPLNQPRLLSADGVLLVVAYGDSSMEASLRAADPNNWLRFDASTNSWVGPLSLANIAEVAQRYAATDYVAMYGLYDCMAKWKDVADIASRLHPMKAVAASVIPSTPSSAEMRAEMFSSHPGDKKPEKKESSMQVDEEKGKYTCPVCWLKFNSGDVMSIASHPDLMGDDILGRDSMKRFWAERFNARGQALDEMGLPCTDLACPHCRRKLPPHFLDMDAHIFSIIGAPSSGKSYYLASLVHEMARSAGVKFNLTWRDADPSGNTMLNEVVNRLFSSDTPEEASLSKTDLEGALYEEFYRHGRMVKLPKPFIFDVSLNGSRKTPLSLVFYDNAGEHFEPGRNSEDSPGAQHVAVADGLFFLFDPTTSRPFKKLIGDKEDPQLHQKGKLDQQEVIMAETITRISTVLNLRPGERIDKPLAVMVGKCDLWEELLDAPLRPIYGNGGISQSVIQSNSDIIRRFLIQLHPALCTAAESLSTDVRYFAISQLGCSPKEFVDPVYGGTKIGPDPNMLNPRYVCDPTYWVLSRLSSDFVPSR